MDVFIYKNLCCMISLYIIVLAHLEETNTSMNFMPVCKFLCNACIFVKFLVLQSKFFGSKFLKAAKSCGKSWRHCSVDFKAVNITTYGICLNPFFFIRVLSCPRSVQTSLNKNCLNLKRYWPGNQASKCLFSL
jgi:hypothetical protein